MGFLGGSDGKESACNVTDMGSIPGSGGSSPGEGHGKSLQHSCLENSMDRRAWKATVHGVRKESDMTELDLEFKIPYLILKGFIHCAERAYHFYLRC